MVLIGGLLVVIAAAVAGWVLLRGHSDPVASARNRMARNDMKGASLYLRQAVKAHPADAEAAFLLGQVDLSLNNPVAADVELRRARAHGYDPVAIILPLGQSYLQQRHFDELLRDFDPERAPPGGRANVLIMRAAAQSALRDSDGATRSAAQAEALAPASPQVLLGAARVALARNDLDGAGDRAARVLAGDPKQGDALLLQAEIALRRNDAKTALARAEAVLAITPGRIDAKLMQARGLAATGQEAAARRAAEEVLHVAPRDVPANFLRAMLAIRTADYAAADASLQQINPVVGDLPRGSYFLAVAKLGLGQVAQAEEAATQFLAHSPDDIPGLKLMTFIHLARHQPDRALTLLQDSALAAQQDADTLDLHGRALAMSGDLKGAAQNFTKASNLAPRDIQILNRLAATELNMGNAAAGEADLQQSLRLDPNQRVASEAVVTAALARGDTGSARAAVEELRHSAGDSEAVGVLSAQVKVAALDLAGAQAELQDVLKRFPGSRLATLNLVRVCGLRGDRAQAERLLQAQLDRQPADPVVLDLLLPALFAANQPERAVAAAEAAHKAAPADPAMTATLAAAYARAKQPERAVGLLDRASAGSNPMLDELRARLLEQQGKIEQARKAYELILEQAPGTMRVRSELAGLLMQKQDFDGARAVLRDGLAQSPGNRQLLAGLVSIDLKQGGAKAALEDAAALRAVPANRPAADALPGEIWLAAGDIRQAAAAFDAAYKAAPSSELAIQAARALAGAGSTAQATALLEGFSATHPGDSAVQALLSSFYLKAGRLDDAARRLTAVLAVQNTDAAALNNLAWIRQQQGDAGQARALAERAYFQSPRPEIADTLGWILAKQGETAKALPLLQAATSTTDPSLQASSAYHYGYALAAAGRREEARSEVQKAVSASAEFAEKNDAKTFLAALK